MPSPARPAPAPARPRPLRRWQEALGELPCAARGAGGPAGAAPGSGTSRFRGNRVSPGRGGVPTRGQWARVDAPLPREGPGGGGRGQPAPQGGSQPAPPRPRGLGGGVPAPRGWRGAQPARPRAPSAVPCCHPAEPGAQPVALALPGGRAPPRPAGPPVQPMTGADVGIARAEPLPSAGPVRRLLV